jgi:cyclohexa-1,5-dienecarbonyl-CoA hydratase
VEEHRKEQAPGMLAALYEVCRAISRMPFPTVALVHGSCLGGALEVISFCDFVVADPAAQFGVPEISLAFFPPIACSTFPEITGRQNASYLILTGEMIDAEAARAMGLVQKIVARDEWETVEKRFNNTSLPVARLARKAIMNASARFREQELESLRDLFISELYDFEDVDEGIASFGEKRKPVWKHR